MQIPLKILIVEDEMIIAANLAMQLENIGYEILGIIPRGEDAINAIKTDKPDLVLMDINLKGELDGIETATQMQLYGSIPIIYLTANTDEAHFTRAKATNPYAFLSKPFKKLDLKHAIELAGEKILAEKSEPQSNVEKFVLDDRIFVRHNEVMVKIIIDDIYYLEADRNYCQVFTKTNTYLLVNTLKNMEEKLPNMYFQRIHRSYIVNIKHINEVALNHVTVDKTILPLSKELRKDLLNRLKMI
ncbi:LytR/AlgR family response regulator transcription factor [Lacihabitans soyangensis]|uniref:DNA-binding response regulator n=1 Tax=Lacihabitans soyangensis TaxID=869394 RepID=A0AAE3H609_9BACT|nr:response regulator [Lacihabitans soyangensis]MCP9764681.1 DNA-binding response regulator [Lacihabitans soyangensis]